MIIIIYVQITFVDKNTLGKDRYLVELTHHLTGPMKLEMHTQHVEKHGIFRLRQNLDEELIYLERHKKSVLNVKGKKSIFLF